MLHRAPQMLRLPVEGKQVWCVSPGCVRVFSYDNLGEMNTSPVPSVLLGSHYAPQRAGDGGTMHTGLYKCDGEVPYDVFNNLCTQDDCNHKRLRSQSVPPFHTQASRPFSSAPLQQVLFSRLRRLGPQLVLISERRSTLQFHSTVLT